MSAAYEVTTHIAEDPFVARCRAGDLDAFGQVYDRYGPVVFRYAYHLLGNHDDAADVQQETFVKAYQAVSGFRGDCALQTWLLRICGNLCRDRLKSFRHRTEVLFDPHITSEIARSSEAGEGEDPAAALVRAQEADILHAALQALPAAHREIIVLREFQELSVGEIAEVLGCSRASAGVRLFRARHHLKERVKALLSAKGMLEGSDDGMGDVRKA